MQKTVWYIVPYVWCDLVLTPLVPAALRRPRRLLLRPAPIAHVPPHTERLLARAAPLEFLLPLRLRRLQVGVAHLVGGGWLVRFLVREVEPGVRVAVQDGGGGVVHARGGLGGGQGRDALVSLGLDADDDGEGAGALLIHPVESGRGELLLLRLLSGLRLRVVAVRLDMVAEPRDLHPERFRHRRRRGSRRRRARALGAGAGAPSDAEISRATSGAFGDEPGPEAPEGPAPGGASAEDIARGAERGGRNAGGPARERASRGVRGARAWHSRESHAAKEQHSQRLDVSGFSLPPAGFRAGVSRFSHPSTSISLLLGRSLTLSASLRLLLRRT